MFHDVQQKYPFINDVFCLLPDHFHCIWTLPEDDFDYSTRMKELKRLFSRKYPKIYREDPVTLSYSRQKRGEGAIYQLTDHKIDPFVSNPLAAVEQVDPYFLKQAWLLRGFGFLILLISAIGAEIFSLGGLYR